VLKEFPNFSAWIFRVITPHCLVGGYRYFEGISLFSLWNYAGSGIVHGYGQVTRRMVTQTHRKKGKNGAPSNSMAVPTL
jgi:hypothetical protein